MKRFSLLAVLLISTLASGSQTGANRSSPVYGSPGPACRDSCAARCMAISCPGVSESQCQRERMACRTRCSTRC